MENLEIIPKHKLTTNMNRKKQPIMNRENFKLRFVALGGSLLTSLRTFGCELALVMAYCVALPLSHGHHQLTMVAAPIMVCCLLLRQWILTLEKRSTKVLLSSVELLLMAAAVVCLVVRRENSIAPDTTLVVLNGAVTPLLYLLGRPQLWRKRGMRENGSFLGLTLNTFVGIGVGYAIAIVLLLLGVMLYASMEYLFFSTILPSWLGWILTMVCLVWLPTWLWMDSERRAYERPTIAGFWAILLNYLLKPAVLLYTALLYCYMLRIVILWELPSNSVASMVFAYAIIALVVKILQQYQERPMLNGLFNHIGWFILPTLVLFWAGVMRRIGDYGLTPERYYLVVCGALMTLYSILSLPQLHKRKVDFGFFMLMLAAFVATISTPSLGAHERSIQSQLTIVRENANKAGMLTEEGFIDLYHEASPADTLYRKEHHKVGDAVYYLEENDPKVLKDELHLTSATQYWKLVPDINRWEIEEPEQWIGLSIASELNEQKDYPTVYPTEGFRYVMSRGLAGKESIHYPGGTYKFNEKKILNRQLERLGVEKDKLTQSWMDDHRAELLRYEDDEVVIYLYGFNIKLRNGKIEACSLVPDIIMIK